MTKANIMKKKIVDLWELAFPDCFSRSICNFVFYVIDTLFLVHEYLIIEFMNYGISSIIYSIKLY